MFTPEKRVIRKYDRENVKINDGHIDSVLKWITDRDLEILRLLVKHPFLTIEQIEMMVFANLSPSSWRNKANERIRRLYHAHCIDRWFPPTEKDAGSSQQHIVLDKAGAVVLARKLGYDPKKMKFRKRNYIPQHYRHTLKIFDFKAMLNVLNRQLGVIDGGTVGEVITWKTEHETKMTYRDERGKKYDLIPDAFCAYKYTTNDKIKLFFLECDNATEDMEDLESKIRRYIECYKSGVWREERWGRFGFPAVVFLLHDEQQAKELTKFAQRQRSNIIFLFTTYDKLMEKNVKIYENNRGKRREVLQEVKVNILEPIWLSSQTEGTVAL